MFRAIEFDFFYEMMFLTIIVAIIVLGVCLYYWIMRDYYLNRAVLLREQQCCLFCGYCNRPYVPYPPANANLVEYLRRIR